MTRTLILFLFLTHPHSHGQGKHTCKKCLYAGWRGKDHSYAAMRLQFQNAKANVTASGKFFEVKNKLVGVSSDFQWPEEGEMILMLESQTSVPVDSRRELPEGLNLKEYTYSWCVGICHLKKPFQAPSTELPYYWSDWRDTKTKNVALSCFTKKDVYLFEILFRRSFSAPRLVYTRKGMRDWMPSDVYFWHGHARV